MGLVLSVSGAQARYWDEHAAILDAILVGDARTAEEARAPPYRRARARRPHSNWKQSSKHQRMRKRCQTQRV